MGFAPPSFDSKSKRPDWHLVLMKTIKAILDARAEDLNADGVINKCLPIKEFRQVVSEHCPTYRDKIKLWEKLHGE